MKNIRLVTLLTALAIGPTHVLAFSNAAIAQQNAALAKKQAVAAALGRAPTQADMAIANALPAGVEITADSMAAVATGDDKILTAFKLAFTPDNLAAVKALRESGLKPQDIKLEYIAVVAFPQHAAFRSTLINFITKKHFIPGGIAKITAASQKAKVTGKFYTSLKVVFTQIEEAKKAKKDTPLFVLDENFAPGITKNVGDYIAYDTANLPVAGAELVGGGYTTLDDQVQ